MHSETDAEKRRLERWKNQNAAILGYAAQLTLSLDGESDEEIDEDVVPQELLDKVDRLSRDEYKVDEILDETFLDLDQIVRFLAETRKSESKHDDKLQKLTRLLKSKELAGRKVLIFSEFADTARYIAKHLVEAGVEGILNYAPVSLAVPASVKVQYIDPAIGLHGDGADFAGIATLILDASSWTECGVH